jgi:hypothetical protein
MKYTLKHNKTVKNKTNKTAKNKNNVKNKHNVKHNKTAKKIFSKQDYAAKDGMVTRIWGPPLWHYLHTMSFNYPLHPTPQEKKHYKDFILNLQYVLPCKYCRMNLTNNFKRFPIKPRDMSNRESFSRYIYNLHELVNKMLDKQSNLTYSDVRERYEHFRARCTDTEPKLFKFTKSSKEKGCTVPLYGTKSKCVINIVPDKAPGDSINIDKKCMKRRY